jgi:hypothetical protein
MAEQGQSTVCNLSPRFELRLVDHERKTMSSSRPGAQKFCLLFLQIVLLSACKQESAPWKAHAFTTQDLSRSDVQGRLPQSLWEKITAVLAEQKGVSGSEKGHGGEGKGHEAKGGEGGAAPLLSKGPLPSVFAPLKVYLIEKNHGILSHGNTAITLAAGGGTIDLHDFVLPRSGSFYFAVEFLPAKPTSDVAKEGSKEGSKDAPKDTAKEALEPHVFFLSGSRIRTIDGETFGSGCDTYFDVSLAFKKAMAGDGFLVNTSEGRDTSTLAGTYFFAAAQDGKLYLASLNIKDSAHPRLLCQR